MSNHKLEVANPSDAKAVSALFARSYAKLLQDDYPPEILASAMPYLSRANPELLGSGTYYLVKTDAGQVIGAGGWTSMRPSAPGAPGTKEIDVQTGLAHIRHFAVDPDHTRQGIGKMLFDRCVKDAVATKGVTHFECYATLTARSFYESLGFEVIGTFDAPFAPDFTFPSLHMRNGDLIA
ncbi:MAG: GNAT family N-acetyltransferase [Rhodospirillales bacterium]|nr:GNAT family N-acetyltransferase [Rhodospirillales bacterium]